MNVFSNSFCTRIAACQSYVVCNRCRLKISGRIVTDVYLNGIIFRMLDRDTGKEENFDIV